MQEPTMRDAAKGGQPAVGVPVDDMRMAWIRWRTGVPARVGGRVRHWLGGRPREGTIEGCSGSYLRVRFDGAVEPALVPATWYMQYLDETGRVIWADKGLEAHG